MPTRKLDRNIAFNYLQRDVPEGYEYGLELYYSGDEGKTWVPLKAQVNAADNLAVARMRGSGLYVLATSVDVPLTGNATGNWLPTRSLRSARSRRR